MSLLGFGEPWGFGPDEMTANPPDEAAIKDKLNQIGYSHLKLKEDGGLFAKKDIPRLYVDLSGIAKGYGVDQVALLLERLGLMVHYGRDRRRDQGEREKQKWSTLANSR